MENQPVVVKKPSVPFSSATIDDCTSERWLALYLRYIDPYYPSVETLRIPQTIDLPTPSDFFCDHLLGIYDYFSFDNETACKMLIDALLLEVLKSGGNNEVKEFCKVSCDWEGEELNYNGAMDYMLGSSISNSSLVIVQAKTVWPRDATPKSSH